jgi:deoxyribose-phosphate aldolase
MAARVRGWNESLAVVAGFPAGSTAESFQIVETT